MSDSTPGAEVDEIVANVIARNETTPGIAGMITLLDIEASLATDSGVDFSMEIMENVLSAETEDELFAAQLADTLSGKDYVDVPFTLKFGDITWMRAGQSFIEQGAFPFYALIKVTDMQTGDEQTLNCGGKTFVATLFKLQRIGGFDKYPDGRPLVIKGKQASGSGNTYLYLMPWATPVKGAKK